MSKERCCSWPDFWALYDRLFKPPNKNEVDNTKRIDKLQIQPVVPSTPATEAKDDGEEEIYTALWAFQARAEEELSFQEGELFRIYERSGNWWTAVKLDKNGEVTAKGFVPYNYLARTETVKEYPWYFGTLSRFETENFLLAPGNELGTFLVRQSERDSIGCVLSVLIGLKAVKHIKIHKDDEGTFYLDQSNLFSNLEELVEHYNRNSLECGIHLTKPCIKPEPKPQDLSHLTVDEWELPKEEFTLEKQLGNGYFADVYRGKYKGVVNVAIKILKKNESMDHKEFLMETQILKKLRHRHLITLYAVCTSSTPFYIITELMEKGNLLSFLRGQEGRKLEPHTLTEMASQVADGMSYLEEQSSIHRDLAARNVLVGQNNICKVADFGLARIVKEPIYTSEDKKIPYKWCAPEAISHGRFSNKSDVWSFGILLYEIFSYGGVPYPAHSNREVYLLIGSGYRMPAPDKCPSYIYDIMLMCWNFSAEKRPDFKELKKMLINTNRYTEWSPDACSDNSDPAECSHDTHNKGIS